MELARTFEDSFRVSAVLVDSLVSLFKSAALRVIAVPSSAGDTAVQVGISLETKNLPP